MPSWEGIRIRYNRLRIKYGVQSRKSSLNSKEFTIISNNCWGGIVYQSYALQKQSPTVGCFFFADDYILFLKHLREFVNTELQFITPFESKWKSTSLLDFDTIKFPIGILKNQYGTVEIFFMHYTTLEDAKKKWERRCRRINWDKLLIKFSEMNECTKTHINEFESLTYKNKICFAVNKYPECETIIQIKAPKSHDQIKFSYEPICKNKYIDITNVLNEL